MVKRTAKRVRAPTIREQLVFLAGESERARFMDEVERFRAVPTIFPSFNRASMMGGAALSCVWLVHGPSAGGKTAFLCGLIRSFQEANGLTSFFDAELAADTTNWFQHLGVHGERCLYYGRTDPKTKKKAPPLTYERIVEEVDGLIFRFQEGKRTGNVIPGTPLLIIVDSISKCVPEGFLEKLSQRGEKKGGDALKSGVGRVQAQMNTGWLLGLGPIVGDDDIAFCVVAHENEGEGWGEDFKVRGGQGMIFDSMMRVRIEFAGRVKDLSADTAPMTGKRHRLTVLKNKLGPIRDQAVFYTSTGRGLCPTGFDLARETIHEGIARGLVQGPKIVKGAPELLGSSKLEYDGVEFKLADCYDPENAHAAGVLLDLTTQLNELALGAA